MTVRWNGLQRRAAGPLFAFLCFFLGFCPSYVQLATNT